jgi:hypothetical protein
MGLQSQPPIEHFITWHESPDKDLDVSIASAKHPVLVRDALLKALRLVPLRPIDLTLLRIEHELQTSLNLPWQVPAKLSAVLNSCRQGTVLSRTERLLFEHRGDFAIVVLGVATRRDTGRKTKYDSRWLFREIDPLSEEDMTTLTKNIQGFPKKPVVLAALAVLSGFTRSPSGILFSRPGVPPNEHD